MSIDIKYFYVEFILSQQVSIILGLPKVSQKFSSISWNSHFHPGLILDYLGLSLRVSLDRPGYRLLELHGSSNWKHGLSLWHSVSVRGILICLVSVNKTLTIYPLRKNFTSGTYLVIYRHFLRFWTDAVLFLFYIK